MGRHGEPSRFFKRLECLLDRRFEHPKRLCAHEKTDARYLAGIVRMAAGENKAGGAAGTALARLGHIAANRLNIPAIVQALLELFHVEPQGLGMRPPGSKRLAVGKQAIVHLPEFPLLLGAVCSFGSLEGQRVNRFQGQVENDIAQLACGNVFFVNLRIRLTDVAVAEGSLIVGELNER
jgi:hypothetical protein